MKVTIIPIVISAFGTVTKGLLKGLEDLEVANEWRPFKLQHYWERPEYWEESWRLEENCCHSNFNERPSANADVKNSQGVNKNYYNCYGFNEKNSTFQPVLINKQNTLQNIS